MRREEIEHAALRLFADRPIGEVSVRDIAAAARCGESGLYRHMTSKEELAARIFRKTYAALAADLFDALPADGTLEDNIAALAAHVYHACDADPVRWRFLVLRQYDGLPVIEDDDPTPTKIVWQVIQTAMERGEIPPQALDSATAFVTGAILQPIVFHVYGQLSGPLVPRAGRIAAMTVAGLSAPV